ncbi:hypothetical protein PAF17_03900 [Paracoccus sp. Z330]|uniref:Uncharacterized protein n=1 Tax=Paracoccus onchidii TaxID=3017813 RepID=A0ABT4ZBL1_9RHOB|nr:hypothetical protein [Paracoccus onchidii]MDB6176645.1 hypothetical protein [Paracoccus onchidii]
MTQLTALERDLLACVERLVTASEASAKDLTGLETRSTGRIEKELAGLKDCVTLLIRSQAARLAGRHAQRHDPQRLGVADDRTGKGYAVPEPAAAIVAIPGWHKSGCVPATRQIGRTGSGLPRARALPRSPFRDLYPHVSRSMR